MNWDISFIYSTIYIDFHLGYSIKFISVKKSLILLHSCEIMYYYRCSFRKSKSNMILCTFYWLHWSFIKFEACLNRLNRTSIGIENSITMMKLTFISSHLSMENWFIFYYKMYYNFYMHYIIIYKVISIYLNKWWQYLQ